MTKKLRVGEISREIEIALKDFEGKENTEDVRKAMKKAVYEVLSYYLDPCPSDNLPGDKWPYSTVKAAREELREAEDKRFLETLLKREA